MKLKDYSCFGYQFVEFIIIKMFYPVNLSLSYPVLFTNEVSQKDLLVRYKELHRTYVYSFHLLTGQKIK